MEEVLDTLLEEQELLHKKVLLSNNFKKDFKEDFRIICDQIVELQKIFIKTIFTQKNT